MSKYYGENVSIILVEIAEALWDIDARENQEPYEYTPEAIRAVSKIMMSTAMDRLWYLQEKNNATPAERIKQVTDMAEDLKEFYKKHLDIDTRMLYERIDI